MATTKAPIVAKKDSQQILNDYKKALTELNKPETTLVKEIYPFYRTRLWSLSIILLSAIVALPVSYCWPELARWIILLIVGMLLLYSLLLVISGIYYIVKNPINNLEERGEEETKILTSLVLLEKEALLILRNRIKTQIAYYKETSIGISMIPLIILGVGTIFTSLNGANIFHGIFSKSIIDAINGISFLPPIAFIAVGLGLRIGKMMVSFDKARLTEWTFYIEGALRLQGNPVK